MPNWIGRTIAKVELQQLLGRGAMAEVYLGRHTTLQRPVAVKVLFAHLADDPDLLARFEREARAVATLRHPNIVQIFDFDVVDGRPFIVMELVQGPSLADYLAAQRRAGRPLPADTVVRLIAGVAAALDYAHARGIVHRDIKPANVLLSHEHGPLHLDEPLPVEVQPILTDFGVMRLTEVGGRSTTAGTIYGTPAYMSPEQARGERVDGRSDIYSLGVVLYEMLAGTLPFAADTETPASLLIKHIAARAPALPNATPAVQAVLDRVLAKDLDARYQHASDLAADLQDALGLSAGLAPTLRHGDLPTHAISRPPQEQALAGDRQKTPDASVPPAGGDLPTRVSTPVPLDTARRADAAPPPPDAERGERPVAARSIAPVPPAPPAPGWGATTWALLLIAAVLVVLVGAVLFGGKLFPAAGPAPGSTLVATGTIPGTPEQAVVRPTPPSTATVAAAAVVTPTAAAPTATSVAVVAPTPVPTSPQPEAAVQFHDASQLTDQVVITFSNLPAPPAVKAYFAWLINSTTGASTNLGSVEPGAGGSASVKFANPAHANLLAAYDQVLLSRENLEIEPTAPSADIVLTGRLPPAALVHIRHLLVSFPGTPQKIGLEVGLRTQVNLVFMHAGFLRAAQQAGNLAGVRLHAEHLVNIIEGAKGPDYGDLNKDGQIGNPGDGFGLLENGDQLGYLRGAKDHAALAANAPDATATIKTHAAEVGVTVENMRGWVEAIRDRALALEQAPNLQTTAPLLQEIFTLANNAYNGVPTPNNGPILPVAGSGGALSSYAAAQLMAAFPVR